MRHSSIFIYSDRIINNINIIKSKIYPHQQILAIVKANGYGTDAKSVVKVLVEKGIKFFGVASIYEALSIRETFKEVDIIVLSPFLPEEVDLYLTSNIITTITDIDRAVLINRIAYSKGKVVRAHVKVDTGMGRLGVVYDDAEELIKKVKELKNINLEGVFTHFPSADIKDDFTLEQISLFKRLIDKLKEHNILFKYLHSANSGGIVFYNDTFFNLVRPGLLMYGAYPSEAVEKAINVNNSIKWFSNILEIKKIKKGSSVSYGRTFKTDKDMKIGVVGVGYADGFLSLNSNNGFFYINGRRANIIGRVCMDYTIVDISGIEAKIGDEVIICDSIDGIRINDISKRTGLIPYEVLTGIGPGVRRFLK
ncbi:MAG TPA: alanine racemase [Spirochaetota bacterium]|nr:alanine racemase [Spirochaetota bacterium]HOM37604.1 alanine racemase [Spirochaetota bacterium]HPQ49425.1 alanine racemase [Spirochaetota bacterium]